MKLNCPKSGLIWHASIGYGAATCEHPIFSTPLKQLIKWSVDINIANEDKVLVSLGLLNYLPTKWETVINVPLAGAKLVSNISALAALAGKIDVISRLDVPTLVINKSTADLENLHTWIEVMNDSLNSESARQKDYRLQQKLYRKEEVIVRLLNSELARNKNKLAIFIADWACEAAEFPHTYTYLPAGTPIRLSDYWKGIIEKSFKDDQLELLSQGVDYDDLCDLVEWLEFNIPHGSAHAAVLMAQVRRTMKILEEFTARKVRIKSTAEHNTPEPKRTQFSSSIDYLKARLAWVNSKTEVEPSNPKIDTNTTLYLDL